MSNPEDMYANLAAQLIRDEMARGPGPTLTTNEEDGDVQMTNKNPSPPTPYNTTPSLSYAYRAHELINLELMKRHESNLWRAYNQDSEQARASIQRAGQVLAGALEETATKRKREAEEKEQSLDAKRRQLNTVMTNVASVKQALAAE